MIKVQVTRTPKATRRGWATRGAVAAGSGWLAVLGAACSAGGDGGAAGSDNQSATANAQPVTVHYVEETVPEGQAFAAEFNKRFNATFAPRITAVTEPQSPGSWAERFQKLTTMAVGGTLPDITWLATNVLRPFMLSGAVRDLDAFIKKDWKQPEIDDFYKGLFDGMKINGKQFGIPVGANCNTLFINLNHMKEAGLAYPTESWTRDQFLDYATKLTRRDGSRWGYDMSFADTGRNAT